MKKILFTAVSALAIGAAIAADSTQFGVLRVPSSTAQTIVAVPWAESSTDGSNVSVSNLVLTAGLTDGDELLYYKGGTGYESWVLSGGQWTPGNNATENGVTKSKNASDQRIPPGKAIILKRQNPSSDGFCIMGKPTTAAASMELPSGQYSLIAPPTVNADGWAINGAGHWSGLQSAKETLSIPNPTTGIMDTYRYIGSQWKNTKTGATDALIPVGTGAWFYSSGSGTKTVIW